MTITRRRIYFYALVLVFCIAAPAVILYSQGYTLNMRDLSLKKTGAIFVSTSPKGVRVLVNGILKATTSDLIFSQGKLLSHLAPGEYEVRIEKDGYLPWGKQLVVEPQLVTEARSIFLVPESPPEQVIEENVSDVIISDSNALLAYVKGDSIAILDVSSPAIIPLSGEKGEKIGKVRFGADENYLIVESLLANKVKKYLLEVKTGEITRIAEDDEERLVKIRQYPEGEPRIVALSSAGNLYWIDLRSQNERTLIARDIGNFELFGSKALYATAAPTIVYEKDLLSGRTEQLNQTPIGNFNLSSKMLRSDAGYIAVIDDKKFLHLYRNEEKAFVRIADGVLDAAFSEDDRKLMWQSKNEIHVSYLKDSSVQPRRKQGDTELITRFSGTIGSIAWFSYDSEHILFAAEGKLKFVELDGRDRRNTYDVSEVKRPAVIIYNRFDDFIYLLDGHTLKKITLIKNS